MINFDHGVRLGTLDEKDLPKIRAWRNDLRIYTWCRQYDLITETEHATWFKCQTEDPTIRMYGAYNEKTELCGVCGLTSIDPHNRRAEFSLYIAPEYQGMGLAPKALLTLVSHGMANLGLNCIWGESFDGNPAIEIFQRLGFMHEGIRRECYFRSGKFIDAHLYSILFAEWLKNPAYNKEQKWN